MRKKRFALLVAILAVTLLLTACAGVNLTLTFEVDGEAYATVTTSGQEAVQMPKDPTKEDYLFDGWYWDKDVWVKPFTANSLLETPLSENMTVYAKWKHRMHAFGEWTVVTAATCTAEGTEKRVCECGEAETRVIAIKAHDYITKHDATNHWKECSVCEEKKDVAPHTYVSGACTICGKHLPTEGLEYKKIDGGYEVSGIGTAEESNIVIPSTYEGEPVIKIGYEAFDSRSLVSVVIPSSVTSIGSYAFSWCRSLVSVVIPSSVTSIGNDAFKGCGSLESIVIPESVICIGDVAFQGCSSLKSVEIPNSVTSIGGNPFAGCESLETLTVAEGNTKYHSEGNCLIETETKTLISGCKNSIIPTDGSVTSIGTSAFRGCSSLISVVIPDSVTSIGSRAFSECSNLETITVAEGNTKYHSAGNCIIETETKTLIAGCKNSIIPTDGSVTSIGIYAFEGCSSLVSVEIPDSVTNIGSAAFFACSSLVSVEIPSGVTSISGSAFYACSSLKSIVIPSSVTYIGSYAFYGCSSLVSIEIPSSVTYIGSDAFRGCSSLVSIEIPNSVTSIGAYAFSNCSSLIIYAEASAKPSGWDSSWNDSNCPVLWDYKNNDVADDGFIYTVQNGIRYGIKDGAATVAKQPRNITTANIPSEIVYKDNAYNVTSIGSYAFYNCRSLVSIEIPSSVTSIGSDAFSWCSSLVSIEIPNSVTSIGSDAFWGCSSLTKVEISDIAAWCGIEFGSYDANPLYYAKHLYLNGEEVTELVIPEGVTSIGSHAFSWCSSLVSVEIPNSVTSIGSFAFWGCNSLVIIEIPNSVTSIDSYTFSNCSNLANIEYGGTKAEWKDKITKGRKWNNTTGNYTVTCTDGTLTKEESEL